MLVENETLIICLPHVIEVEQRLLTMEYWAEIPAPAAGGTRNLAEKASQKNC